MYMYVRLFLCQDQLLPPKSTKRRNHKSLQQTWILQTSVQVMCRATKLKPCKLRRAIGKSIYFNTEYFALPCTRDII